jgi:four helix bundle protein
MIKLNHKNLSVWKKSLLLVKEIYILTKKLPKEEIYCLTSQLRRAAISITSNIAEGAARKSAHERKRFFEVSRPSLVEIDTQIEICLSIEYFTFAEIEELSKISNEVFALFTAMIKNS